MGQASIVFGEGGSFVDQPSIKQRRRRGAALALAALAGLALLLA
jgi:hypothetical protein